MKISLSLLCAFALIACSTHSEDPCKGPMIPIELLVSGACEEELSEDFGWQPAGFSPVVDKERGGSLRKVTHSKDWLILMDLWSSPVEGKPNYLTFSPRLFISKIGSSTWDTIAPPTDAYIKKIFADPSGLYVGTYQSGEIWKYSPENKTWARLLKKSNDAGGEFHVVGIGNLSGRLVASIAGYKDSLDKAEKRITTVIAIQKDSSWNQYEEENGLQFLSAVEISGTFFVSAYDLGVCKLNLNSGTYQQLAQFPPHLQKDSVNWVKDILVHKEKLYAVTQNIIYQWDKAGYWISIDSIYYQQVNDDVQIIHSSAPSYINAFATDGKHLFSGGRIPSIPMVYMGDYGPPYGNELKGWRLIDGNWCTKHKCQSKDAIQSLDAVGDTLYAVTGDGLFKFPLAELDSAIANEDSYYLIPGN